MAECPRCGYTVLDADGIEQPCNRPATGWRWYQNVGEHEDCLDPACDWHANEGGWRIHRAEAAIERVRKIAFDPEIVSGLEHGVIGTSPDTYGGIGKDEAIDIGVYALRDIRAALDGSETP